MAEQTFKKETDGYGESSRDNDFAGESEIMVTITLHEYRDLVRSSAKHTEELRKKGEEAYKARRERDAANAKLQGILDKLGVEAGDDE